MDNNTKQNYQEDELVSLLKVGDRKVMSILYDNYSPALFGVILRIVRSEEIAEDVLQEAFIKIWKKSASYNASKGRLFTWLLNIARNSAIDTIRSKDHKKSTKNQSIENGVYWQENMVTNISTDSIGVKEIVDKLKPEHKAVIDCVYFNGFTHNEAAKALNLPLGTVKTRLKIAIRNLKLLMN